MALVTYTHTQLHPLELLLFLDLEASVWVNGMLLFTFENNDEWTCYNNSIDLQRTIERLGFVDHPRHQLVFPRRKRNIQTPWRLLSFLLFVGSCLLMLFVNVVRHRWLTQPNRFKNVSVTPARSTPVISLFKFTSRVHTPPIRDSVVLLNSSSATRQVLLCY